MLCGLDFVLYHSHVAFIFLYVVLALLLYVVSVLLLLLLLFYRQNAWYHDGHLRASRGSR
jgi:hypothetical protein